MGADRYLAFQTFNDYFGLQTRADGTAVLAAMTVSRSQGCLSRSMLTSERLCTTVSKARSWKAKFRTHPIPSRWCCSSFRNRFSRREIWTKVGHCLVGYHHVDLWRSTRRLCQRSDVHRLQVLQRSWVSDIRAVLMLWSFVELMPWQRKLSFSYGPDMDGRGCSREDSWNAY